MTAHPVSLSESLGPLNPGATDTVTQTTPSVHRAITEPGSTSDNITRLIQSLRGTTETVSGSQTVTRSASHPRGLTETHSVSDTPTRILHSVRIMHDDAPAPIFPHLGLYPGFALFPGGSTYDILTTTHAAARILTENLPAIQDVTTRSIQFIRPTSETLSTGISVARVLMAQRSTPQVNPAAADHLNIHAGHPRSVSESHSTSNSITRLHGAPRFLTETHATADSLIQVKGFRRFNTETLVTLDEVLRHTSVHRPLTTPLSLTEVLHAFGGHPRTFSEHVGPAFNVIQLSFRAPVMGQLWFDPSDNEIVAQLPDWAFVLIEDPTTGNGLWYQPVNPWIYNPTRTK